MTQRLLKRKWISKQDSKICWKDWCCYSLDAISSYQQTMTLPIEKERKGKGEREWKRRRLIHKQGTVSPQPNKYTCSSTCLSNQSYVHVHYPVLLLFFIYYRVYAKLVQNIQWLANVNYCELFLRHRSNVIDQYKILHSYAMCPQETFHKLDCSITRVTWQRLSKAISQS